LQQALSPRRRLLLTIERLHTLDTIFPDAKPEAAPVLAWSIYSHADLLSEQKASGGTS
jgi:hypothetical protein